ncbi:hypothetical protein R1sor_024013 [Riccia sorocarpa]|uniref:Pectinesterase n=1 Tax=Riccia sorocarpa TaxID=122646 RepID=A0ABD3GRG9_9MARC
MRGCTPHRVALAQGIPGCLVKMAFLLWIIWVLLVYLSSVLADFHPRPLLLDSVSEHFASADLSAPSKVSVACQATRYPDICKTTLATDPRSASSDSTALTQLAIDLGVTGSSRDSTSILQMKAGEPLDLDTAAGADVCFESLDYAVSTLTTARNSLTISPIEDIQAWMSAALQFQYDCFSGLSNVPNPPADLMVTILPQVNSTMQLISIALSMADALAYYGTDTTLWAPLPEERPQDINAILKTTNPMWAKPIDACTSHPPAGTNTPDVTVALDGTGTYSSIQQAVDNAPTYGSMVYIIYIKSGVYNERIRVHKNKTMIMFLSDGSNQTIITGSKSASEPGVVTYQTATVVVLGNGFVARGITFQNMAGSESRQAVAVRVDSDLSAFYDCIFDGFQDTLYAHTGRQFYKSCTIRGTIDFIFGNAAAVFQDCQILFRLREVPGNPTAVVAAQGRTDPGQTTGLVFQNCTISATPEYIQEELANPTAHNGFLGRPWKLFSRIVFVNSFLDSVIEPVGWLAWNGDFALSSLFYGESGSSGPGAVIPSRVAWSNQLSVEQAGFFSVDTFIQGSRWLPCTSIPYTL